MCVGAVVLFSPPPFFLSSQMIRPLSIVPLRSSPDERRADASTRRAVGRWTRRDATQLRWSMDTIFIYSYDMTEYLHNLMIF